MQRQQLTQRLLAWLMACVMALTCAPQALAEDSAKATAMQLQKTEGTVAISNASGKSVPTRDSLRLYNGYRLETEEASYAWINLDKSKLVKEDAVSEISIRKSGKKLDILVDSGNLFFNVSEPLEDDESLNIHTSTMVVGIRGTSGWVKVIDQWTSEVYILEGTVEVTVTDPVTGETKTGTVRSGETASCVVYPQDRPGSKCDILRQTYTEGDIDGFVLVELTPDAPLCEKVLKETGLDLRGPGVKPEERLKKDQAEVREKLEQIADQVQKQDHNVSTEPVWTAPASDSAKPSGSTGSTGSTGGAPAPAPTETVTLTMPQTAATVNDHLSRGTVRQVVLVPGTRQTLSSTATDLDVDSTLTVPAGKILTLQSGVGLTASDGGLLTVRGTLTVDGDFRLSGDLGAGSQNGVIKAKAFKLAADVVSWKVPAATDSAGFYTLAYSPKGAYTVTFNANGGSVTPAPMKTGTDGKLTSLPTPTRTGFAFNGWYTSLTGGELVDTSYVFTRDTTVYARWTENTAPVTGTAGANITWRYDPSTKTLSFTGSGAMTGYGAATDASGATVTNTPWEQYRPEIQSVVIGSGITSIGGYAFTECPKLTAATIPGSVASVNGYAFFESGNLKDVYYDGTEAQWNTITISSGNQPLLDAAKHFTEEAGDPVTGTAGNLNWEYTPATRTLRIWGSGAMDNYALTTFPAVNTPWSDYQTEIEHVVVESGVTTIGDRAFYNCTALTDAQLPSGITRIGNSAFYNCAALKNAPIPNGVTAVLQAAFSGCESITSVTVPDTVASLGHDAFGRCTALADVKLSNNLTVIDNSTFDHCTSLKEITIPNSVTELKNGAFLASGLTSLTLPAGLTTIGPNVFSACTGLTDVYFNGTRAQWNAVTVSATNNDPLLNATIHCTDDGGETGVTWRYDAATKTLYIEGSGPMESIEGYASTNPALATWPWSSDDSVHAATTIVIGNGVTTIGITAFTFFRSVTDVTIPDSVTSIGHGAFDQCTNLASLTIPDSVTSIDSAAFMNCESLTSLTIPYGTTSIGTQMFFSCYKLASVTIPDSVTSIDQMAFNGCNSLTSITIPDRVTSISTGAFGNCSSLTSVTIPRRVTRISQSAFSNCRNLTSVNILGAVTSIDNSAFEGCSSLTDVYFNGTRAQWNAVTIGTSNDPLLNATIHCTDDSEETGVTWRIDGTTLYIEGSGAMENYAFSELCPWYDNRKDITKAVIADGVTSIGSNTFSGFSALTSVTIPASMSGIIGDSAFYQCVALTQVDIPEGVTSIGELAFGSCEKLTDITIPSTVTNIGYRAFTYCYQLSSVTMHEGVINIGGSAFFQCNNLTSVKIPFGVTNIGDSAFSSCGSLTSVEIPSSVTTIDRCAFDYTGLTSITIPSSVTSLGSLINCTKLTDIYFTGTETQWNAITIIGSSPCRDTVTIHYNSPATRSVVNDAAPGYTDVPEDAWYAEAVAFCRENGLMNGTSATEFSPDATLTRAMMVTVLHRLAGLPAAAAPASFADVPAGQWYTEAVSWASGQGIVLGYDGVTFGVDDPVTHEQAGLIFQRYTGGPGVQIPGADAPQAPATRAEIASALMDCARTQAGFASRSAINVMCAPSGIALDRDGSLLVTDVYGKRLWKVRSRSGTVYAGGETVQGLYGEPVGGYNDASLAASYFKEPWAVAPFLDGWAVSDTENGVVRLIQGGSARTLNGATKEQLKVTELGVAFDHPTGLAADGEGNLYISDTGSGAVRKITPEGSVTTAAKGLAEPMGLCWKDGALYIAEAGKNRVVTLADGKVTVLAGSGEDGLTDGGAKQAAFSAPQGVAVGADGSVYVADTGNGAVRVIRGGTVTTLTAGGLMTPRGLLLQGGSLYVCDPFARKIFVIAL